LEIYNMTGDGCNTTNKGGNMAYYLRAATCELGSFNPITGVEEITPNKIRWTNALDVTNLLITNIGYFTLAGTGYGSLGADISATHFDIFFYKSDLTFLVAETKVEFFSRVEPPKDAKWAKFSLYQGTIPADNKNNLMVWNLKFAENIFFEKLDIHHCRRQGMSLQGQFIFVRDNTIHHIGGNTFQNGTDPQGGIDIEDGYDWNQHFFIERNNFYKNWGYDLVITNGKYMYINGNKFSKVGKYVSVALNAPVDKSIFINNRIDQGQVVIAGELLISNNNFFGSNITFGDSNTINNYGRSINVYNNIFKNTNITISQTVPYTIVLDGCKFLNDKFKQIFSNYSLILTLEPQTIRNSVFEGEDNIGVIYNNRPNKGWVFDNIVFRNITKPISLPPGKFNECKFLNINIINIATSSLNDQEIEFIDCYIRSTDQNNNLITIGNAKSLKIEGCHIEKKDSSLLVIQNIKEEVIIKGNTLKYFNPVFLNRPPILIQSTFAGLSLIIDSNYLYSPIKKQLFANSANVAQVIVKNNVLNGFEIKFTNEILVNNIINGVLN
jgi:hypothetical protein